MTKREIVETALKGVGKIRTEGDTMEPIVPYLLADIMYQIYDKDIASLQLKHKMKSMDSMWRKRYGLFNRPLFSAFTTSNSDELTDLMDSIGDYLNIEIVMMRSKILDALSDIEDFSQRRVVSSLVLCHIIAQYADCAYQRCYYKIENKGYGILETAISNPDLCYLRDLSYRMAMQFINDLPGGSIEIKHPDMTLLFNITAKKIYKWLKEN